MDLDVGGNGEGKTRKHCAVRQVLAVRLGLRSWLSSFDHRRSRNQLQKHVTAPRLWRRTKREAEELGGQEIQQVLSEL